MSESVQGNVKTVMQETRLFPPSSEFASKAQIGSFQAYESLYRESIENNESFWDAQAKEHLHWFEPYHKVLEWNEPFAQWFVGGKTNASYNCLDRHIDRGNGDKIAILWEGEPGDTRQLTYRELHREVCRFANGLKKLGVKQGTWLASICRWSLNWPSLCWLARDWELCIL